MSKLPAFSILLLLTLSSVCLHAEEANEADKIIVRNFVSGSLQQIKEEKQGKPFILSFWSVDCTYCFREMEMFSSLRKKYPDLDVVLVSTDQDLDEQVIYMVLDVTKFKTDKVWVFAEKHPDRLYAEIDRNWQGELPHTLFFNSKHEVQSVVGEVKPKLVKRWLQYIRKENS